MAIRVGQRILGNDGTYAKVVSINGDNATVQFGLSGVERDIAVSDLDDWSAPPPPGKPEPGDYDINDAGIIVRPLTEEEIDRAG